MHYMKCFILNVFFICAVHAAFSQDGVNAPNQRESIKASLKGKQVSIENRSFDFRVLKYYTEAELREMTASKRAQIQYLYTESFRVLNPSSCSSLSEIDIDISKLEVYRDISTSKVVEFGTDCKVKIELVSRTALEQKMTQLSKL